MKEGQLVPPDGGWGWMIVLASALNGIATIPILQGFGLIFKDTFPRLGFTATDASVIININLAFGMLLGLVNGPLLRNYGYRKVAIVGTFVYTIGICLTAFAKTFAVIVVSYGILAALGMGVTMSAFSYALNSYFTARRGRATGLALTITGLGPILMPVVTSILIAYYGFEGTMLLYGSFSLHSLIGAMLLHPLKWHLKKVPAPATPPADQSKANAPVDERSNEGEASRKNSCAEQQRFERKRKTTISSIDHDSEVARIYGFETPLPRQLSETLKTPSWEKHLDVSQVTEKLLRPTNRDYREYEWWSSARSMETVNLGSSMRIFEEIQPGTMSRYYSFDDLDRVNGKKGGEEQLLERVSSQVPPTSEDPNLKEAKKSMGVRVLKSIVDFYDLELLLDPIYVNIMLGMSIAIFAEVNFSLLTPFILGDMGLTTTEIATVMSLTAGVDLILRSLAPFLGEWLRQPPRNMYLISLFLLIISRSSLLFANGMTSVLFVAVGLGGAKGIRSVYMSLVVPSYVPIQRLPYASGIQMIINGIILMIAGPLLGVLRDVAGSYTPCIILMNSITGLTIVMWLTEMMILRRLQARNKSHRVLAGNLVGDT